MTIGAIALTRGSPAAVSQLVQPRFDPPVMRKLSTGSFHSCLLNSCKASMALTTLLTMGNSSGQFSSLVLT